MPGQPKKKEASRPKPSGGKCVLKLTKVDDDDSGKELRGMFGLMVEFCERTMEMLGEVQQFQEEACLFMQQFAQRY